MAREVVKPLLEAAHLEFRHNDPRLPTVDAFGVLLGKAWKQIRPEFPNLEVAIEVTKKEGVGIEVIVLRFRPTGYASKSSPRRIRPIYGTPQGFMWRFWRVH